MPIKPDFETYCRKDVEVVELFRTIGVTREVPLTLRERLLSWPWRPWRKTRYTLDIETFFNKGE